MSSELQCRRCERDTYSLAYQAWVAPDPVSTKMGPTKHAFQLLPNVTDQEARCQKCPSGAECRGGDDVVAQFGRWGSLAEAAQHSSSTSSRLCSLATPGCRKTYDSCAGHRVGLLCGHCPDGYGEVLGSAKCTANASCKSWARILALMLLPVGITALTVAYIALAGAAPDPECGACLHPLCVIPV